MANPPDKMPQSDFVRAVEHVIRARRTAKILRDTTQCDEMTVAQQAQLRTHLEAIVDIAGWAPFHKIAHAMHRGDDLTSFVPWRFYIMDKSVCCATVQYLAQQAQSHPDSKWSQAWASKVPNLLAGAGATIIVTWLPDPHPDSDAPTMNTQNIEHIAAASAATQNLMLVAEARGLHTYWATGGILRETEAFEQLGIPLDQAFLGAIYLAAPDASYDENIPGKLRDKRGEATTWAKWLT